MLPAQYDVSEISRRFAGGLRPPPDITVSEWADKCRILARNSPEPGPWRTDRVAYMREIQDNLSVHSGVEMTVLVKAAQGAGTEGLLNSVGYQIDCVGGDVLIVLPTTGIAKKFSRTRVTPLLTFSPTLRNKVAPVKSRDSSNTILLKEYSAGTILLTGANSASGLRSDPIPFLVMDEEDAYPLDIDGEGNPGDLAIQRTATFRNRRILRISTPTILQFSHIWTAFLSGDQRYFHIPMPCCGARHALVWSYKDGRRGGIVWPKGKPEEARYQCESCGELWDEWFKTDALPKGQWVPSHPGNGNGKIRSYQINSLYYPYGWPGSSWPNLALQFKRDSQDPVRFKTFWNLKLGLPWDDPSEARLDADVLYSRREAYSADLPLPAGIALITAGVDVQGDRIECEAVGWGPDEESWSLEYRVFPGDTSNLTTVLGNSPWQLLDQWLQSEWLSEMGMTLGIRAAGVDSGYNTQIVTQFCGERLQRQIHATKGKDGVSRPVYSQKAIHRRGKFPSPQLCGVDTAKEHVYAGLKVVQPGPRFSHFPNAPGYERNYFEMLTAEVRIPNYTKPSPTFEWKKKRTGSRNEALDCRVQAYWALTYLQQAMLVDLRGEWNRLDMAARQRREKEKQASVTGIGIAQQQVGQKQTLRDLLKPIPMGDD